MLTAKDFLDNFLPPIQIEPKPVTLKEMAAKATWARLNYRQRLSEWLQKDFNSYKLYTNRIYVTGGVIQKEWPSLIEIHARTLSQMTYDKI